VPSHHPTVTGIVPAINGGLSFGGTPPAPNLVPDVRPPGYAAQVADAFAPKPITTFIPPGSSIGRSVQPLPLEEHNITSCSLTMSGCTVFAAPQSVHHVYPTPNIN